MSNTMKQSARLLVAVMVVFGLGMALRGALTSRPKAKWTPAAAMTVARTGACAVTLADGRVLVTGGVNDSGSLASSEIIDATGRTLAAAPMRMVRSEHLCVALENGAVLVAGGRTTGGAVTSTAEIYDSEANEWIDAGWMSLGRVRASASLLNDGRVLVAGGESGAAALDSMEIFDPVSAAFTRVEARLSSPRRGHAAAVLADGRVVVAGGSDGKQVLASVDIFNPATGELSAIGNMTSAREGLSATTMLDRRVFLAGGNDGTRDLETTEILDPKTGTFKAASSMDLPRRGHIAVRVPDNNSILIAGGTTDGEPLAAAGLYVPWRNSYEPMENLTAGRAGAAVAALGEGGKVLVAGGLSTRSAEESTQLATLPTILTDKLDYAPGESVSISGANWTPGNTVNIVVKILPERTVTRWSGSATVAQDGTVLLENAILVQETDANLTFEMTASEPASGLTAQAWVFTDSVSSVTITGVVPTTTITSLPATVVVTFDYVTSSTGTTTGDAQILGTSAETLGSSLPNGTLTGKSLSINVPPGTANGTYNIKVTINNESGGGSNQKNDVKNGAVTISVPVDTTPPVITPTVTGTLGNDGWYTSDVSVTWSVTDAQSTITSQSGCSSSTVTSDTAGITFTCSATSAGGTSSQSLTIKRDATAPTITVTLAPASPAPSGWYNIVTGAPTATFVCSDATSGVSGSCPAPYTFPEGSGLSVSRTVTDLAGNTSTPASVTGINVDLTAPLVAATPDRAPDLNGWYNHQLTVTFAATDAGSGLDSCESPKDYNGPDSASASVSGNCTDVAGNTGSKAYDFKFDATAPVVTAAPDRAPNGNGWYNSPVEVAFTGSDATSNGVTCDAAKTYDGPDTSSASVTGSCTDAAGNSGSGSLALKYDATAPTITVTLAPPDPASTGWYNIATGAPTASFVCSDATSGVSGSCPSSYTFPEGSGLSVSRTVTDLAGNTSTPASVTGINVDLIAPSVTATPDRAADHNGWYNHQLTVTFTATDGGSGLGSCESPKNYSGPDSANASVSGNCTDIAGNTGSKAYGFKFDKTAPIFSASATANGSPYTSGTWTKYDVNVKFSCSDELSGVGSYTASPGLVSTEGTTNHQGSCTDFAGNQTAILTFMVRIDKQAPETTDVSLNPNPLEINKPTTLSGTIGSLDPADRAPITSAEYSLDAGVNVAGTMSATDGTFNAVQEAVSATRSFDSPQVAAVCVRGTDAAGNTGEWSCGLLAVYDPAAGFVTGGGWINSPLGAYLADPTMIGKANFGFVAKYQKGAKIPTGNTEFQFQTAKLNFKSATYEWLVVAGARAQFKGVGTINGAGNYGFLLTAIDGQVKDGGGIDKFRIKIWDKDNSDKIVYDNQMDALDTADPTTVIGGGSIVIHSK